MRSAGLVQLAHLRTTHYIYYVNIVKKHPREIRFAHLTLHLDQSASKLASFASFFFILELNLIIKPYVAEGHIGFIVKLSDLVKTGLEAEGPVQS